MCTDPNSERAGHPIYLAYLLRQLGVRVTPIASELPLGGDVKWAPEGRREVEI